MSARPTLPAAVRVLESFPWVADRFAGVREEAGGRFVSAACPLRCHRTARLRLWVSDGKVPGLLCLRCWAGCDRLELLRAVGMRWRDCYPDGTDWKAVPQRVAARYPYRDEAGVLLYEALRLEPGRGGRDKDFRQRRPKPGGGWDWSLGDARRVLYRLPELRAAAAGRAVLVVAGEKDVESLRALGVLATTNVCGESAPWLDDYSRALAGRDVVVVEDADSAGRRHASEACGSLMGFAASLRRATLPQKDATAFLSALRARGVTRAGDLRRELAAALAAAPRWAPV